MIYLAAYWLIVLSVPTVVLATYGAVIFRDDITDRGIKVASVVAAGFIPAYALLIFWLPVPFPSVA